MRKYKLEVVKPFTDINTKEKYKLGKKITVEEERAFELFSSKYHIVKLISVSGNDDYEIIKAENDALKAEIDMLKVEIEKTNNKTENSEKQQEKNNK